MVEASRKICGTEIMPCNCTTCYRAFMLRYSDIGRLPKVVSHALINHLKQRVKDECRHPDLLGKEIKIAEDKIDKYGE